MPRRDQILPVVILAVMATAFIVLPQFLGGRVNTLSVYTIMQTFADFGLVALAVGLGMILAEYDLSAAAVFGLGGLLAVETGSGSPLVGIAVAVASGLVIGAIQGGIMARWRMRSIEVTLGGLLIVSGLTLAIAKQKTVIYERLDVSTDLNQRILEVFSPRSLIVIGVFIAAALVLALTRTGREIRATVGDRRSARLTGVPVSRTLVGVFAIGSLIAALGGALYGLGVGSVAPDVGLNPLIFATIAAILGGVTLSGGRGTPMGIAAGVLSFATLQQTLTTVNAPSYLTALITGGLLILVTVATAPDIGRLGAAATRWRLQMRPASAAGAGGGEASSPRAGAKRGSRDG
jgi:ribose/xylose/arabinose/galactoside ABC-type transport system permease subunit